MSASPARPPTSNLPSEPDFYAAARTVFNEALAEYGLASSQIEEQSVDELEESLEKADTLVKKAETLGKVTFEVPQTGSNDQSAVKQITVEATPFLFETKVNILRRILETRNVEAASDLKQVVSASAAAPTGFEENAVIAAIERVFSDNQGSQTPCCAK